MGECGGVKREREREEQTAADERGVATKGLLEGVGAGLCAHLGTHRVKGRLGRLGTLGLLRWDSLGSSGVCLLLGRLLCSFRKVWRQGEVTRKHWSAGWAGWREDTLVGRSVLRRRGWLPVASRLLHKESEFDKASQKAVMVEREPVWCATGTGHRLDTVHRSGEHETKKKAKGK